jgi:hypothetical protein
MSMTWKTAIPHAAYIVLVGVLVVPMLVFETLLGRPEDAILGLDVSA